MSEILFRIGDIPVSVGLALALGGGLVLAMLASLTLSARRAAQDRAAEAEESFAQARELEARLRDLARIQAETTGRVQSMAEVLAQRQSDSRPCGLGTARFHLPPPWRELQHRRPRHP